MWDRESQSVRSRLMLENSQDVLSLFQHLQDSQFQMKALSNHFVDTNLDIEDFHLVYGVSDFLDEKYSDYLDSRSKLIRVFHILSLWKLT